MFFLNYLRKLEGEGTFSQLISQLPSARIGDNFWLTRQRTHCNLLQQKECK
nr:MAG TPA_asm: hypothetical protein [Caudoviricetes sp.]